MLLTSWIRALRQSFTRRRALSRVRRHVGSTSPVSPRKLSVAEVLEERSLLSALVFDNTTFTSTAASPGINITNSTLDANNDGISDYDNLVIASSDVPITVSGTGIGIRINLSNLTGLNHITIENVAVTGGPVAGAQTFQGISVTLNNVAIQSLTVDQATVTSTSANSIDLNLQNIATDGGAAVTIKDTTARTGSTNFSGVQVTLGSTTQNSHLAALTVADSTLEGIGVTSTAGAAFQTLIDQTSVRNTRVQDGSANPVARGITYNLTRTTVGDLRVEENPLMRGLSVTSTDSPLKSVTIADNTNINLAAAGATNGISLSATTTNAALGTALQSDVTNLLIRTNTIAGNVANNNTVNGIVLNLTDSNLGSYTNAQAGATIRDNIIRNLSSATLSAVGVQITAGTQVLANGTTPFVAANGDRPLLLDFDGDAANDDGNGIINNLLTPAAGAVARHINGQGLVISATANTSFRGDITGNTIQNINREGMLLTFRDKPTSAGFDSFALNVDGNTVDAVRRAGVDLNLVNTAVGAFTITNNQITGVEDAAVNTPDAISVSLIGTNVAQEATNVLRKSFIEDNFIGVTAAGVAGQISRHGIFFTAQEASEVQDLQVRNNILQNLQANGILFDRQDEARLHTVNPESDQVRAVTIAGNSVTLAAQNGIALNVQNGSLDLLDFQVRDNFIGTDANGTDLGNGGDGINLVAQADARMLVDITNNQIQFNNGDGIDLSDVLVSATDKRQIGGTWTENTISNNSGHGIFIRGRHGLQDEATGITTALVIGQETNDATRNNIIQNNGFSGLQVSGGAQGDIAFTDNLVSGNGSLGAALLANVSGIYVRSSSERIAIRNNQIELNFGKGIDLEGTGRLDASVRNNVITRQVAGVENGDGLEVTQLGGAIMNVLATGNFISANEGKGVEVINLGSGAMQFRFGDGTAEGMNIVQRNRQVGFYVINSTDFTQSQDSLAVTSNGAATSTPDMMLDVDTNVIEFNGQGGSTLGGSGLLLRAGSAGAPGTGGGGGDLSFAATYGGEVGAVSGAPGAGNGRINARITNNQFEGNFGNDFVVDAYVSNDQNAAAFQTTGTWDSGATPPVFQIGSIQHDPLARVNLVFIGNTGNGIDVQRGAGAFTNNEADFKSRTGGHVPGPGGPFGSGTRGRSIIRLGGDGAPAFPTVGFSMVYPDNDPSGASTLRVEAQFDRTSNVAGAPFFSTTAPGPGSLNNFDDSSQWTVVPVGTFSYPNVDAPTFLTAEVVDFTSPRNTTPGVVQINFSEFVVNADITDFRLLRNGVAVPLESAPGVPLAVTAVASSEDPNNPGAFRSFTIDLSIPAATEGEYELQVLSVDGTNPTFTSIRDVINQLNGVGNSLTRIIDGDGVLQEYAISHEFTVDTSNPNATISPITPDPRNSAAGIVTVTFDEPVSGVDIADFTLTRDDDGAGPNLPVVVNLGSVTVTQVSSSVYTLNLNQLTGAPGDYQLQLISTDPASQIFDAANNLVANIADIASQDSWTVDTTLPGVVSINTAPATSPNNVINTPVTSVQINFQEAVTGVDLSDFKLTRTDSFGTVSNIPLSVATTPFFTNTSLQYEINLSAVTGLAGTYTLTANAVNSGIFDLAQNALESSFSKTWVLDLTAAGSDIVDVAPDPRQAPVDALNTIFTEAVNGLTIGQYVLAYDDGTSATGGTISNATNASTIVITANGHGLTDGTQITLYGVQGNTNSNGVFTVRNETATTFELFDAAGVNPVPGNGLYAGGGRWARNVSLGSSTLNMQTPIRWVANLAGVTNNPGTYIVSLLSNAGALDQAGNPLLPATSALADIPMQLRDSLGNVMTPAAGQFNVAGQDIWTYGPDVAPTGAITPLPASIGTNAGMVEIKFSEPLQQVSGAAPVNLGDFQLRLNGSPVSLTGVAITQTNATTFLIDLSTVTNTNGSYTFSLLTSDTVSPIRDTTGNLLVASFSIANNLTAPNDKIASQIAWTKIATDPSVTSIKGIFSGSPDSATFDTDPPTQTKLRAVQTLTINFSSPVSFINGLSDASQYFRLTRQAGTGTGPVLPVSLDGLPITQVTTSSYRINVSALTGADGKYTFIVLAGDLIKSTPAGLSLLNSKSISWSKDGTIHVVPDDANNATNANKNSNAVLTDGTDATTLGNEVVRTSGNKVTLRAAIQETNALAGDDAIELGVGTYVLTTGGVQEDFAVSGDLDIRDNLTIRGKGVGQTIIDASGLTGAQRDRIFQIMAGATLTLQGVTLRGGGVLGSEDGGAIRNSGTLILQDSEIRNSSSQDDAGAILNAGTANITRTTLASNTATATGGAIRNTGTLNLTNSTLSANTSTGNGGGLVNVVGGTATLEGVTISGNTSTSGAGGGIRNDGTLRLINDTIAFNRSLATQGGAGISRNGVITIGNTIVSDNVFTNAVLNDLSNGVFASLGGNIIRTPGGAAGFIGTDQLNANPGLQPLANYGGPTQTHAVLIGSAAIDRGLNGNITAGVTTDQRGAPRRLDGPTPVLNAVDVGAIEFGSFFVNTTNDTRDVNPGDGLAEDGLQNTSLRAAIMESNALLGESAVILDGQVYRLNRVDDVTPPVVASILGVPTAPITTGGVGVVTINFSEAVAGFDLTDITLTRTVGAVVTNIPLSAVTFQLTKISDSSYKIENRADIAANVVNTGLTNLTSTTNGLYTLTVNSVATGIRDVNNLALAGPGTVNWVRGADTFAPTVAITPIVNQPVINAGVATVTFSERVNGVSINNFTLTRNAVPVSLAGVTLTTAQDANFNGRTVVTLNLTNVTQLDGNYSLSISPNVGANVTIKDTSNNNLAVVPAPTLWSKVAFTQFAAVTTPRSDALSTVTLQFSEPVAGLSVDDFTLTYNDGSGLGFQPVTIMNPTLAAVLPVVQSPANGSAATQWTFTFNNNEAARDGQYQLSFDGLANGNVLVTATGANFVPTTATVPFQVGEDASLFGDLDILGGAAGSVQIFGVSKDVTTNSLGVTVNPSVIDGQSSLGVSNDRLFDLQATSNVTITGVEMRNGRVVYERNGGGIRNLGALTINSSDLLSSFADGNGGGISNGNSSTAGTVTLSNSTLQSNSAGATGPNSSQFGKGGAIFNDNGTVTVTNSVLSSNAAFTDGGVIYNDNNTIASLSGSTMSNNTARRDGGALYNGDTSTLTILTTTLASNLADLDNDGDGEGGAIFTESSATLTLNTSILRANSARAGGALYNDDASLTLDGNLFELNTAKGGLTGALGIGTGVGGAIFNSVGGTLILTNGVFTTNSASDDGGAIQNYGTLGVTGTEFLNNVAGMDSLRSGDTDKGRGGAIYNDDGSVILTSVEFNQNKSFGQAGALYNQDAGFVSIALSTLDGNTATGNAGAVFNDDVGQVLIDRSTFSSNVSTADGGGFYNNSELNSSPLSPASSQLVGNITAAGGSLTLLDASQFPSQGGFLIQIATETLLVTRVSGNTFQVVRGIHGTNPALHNNGDSVSLVDRPAAAAVITSSTFESNEANRGGAIFNRGFGSLNVQNSTLSSNTATLNAGGLANFGTVSMLNATIHLNDAPAAAGIASNLFANAAEDSPLAKVNLQNTIVAGGVTSADLGGTADSNFGDLGHNLIEDMGTVTLFGLVGSTNILGQNPQLDVLQDNGGPTFTHALLFGSLARDSGDNVGTTAGDQRGFTRIFDGDGNGIATVDIGAFESGFIINSFADTVDEDILDGINADRFGVSTLRATIMQANARVGEDTIILSPGTYTLTLGGRDEDGAVTGDLDITDTLNIIGSGTDQTFIDAAQIDRIFHVLPGVSLNLSNLTLQRGNASATDNGGAIRNQGTVALRNVQALDSSAARGGGIFNEATGTLTVTDSLFRANTAIVQGGAIFNNGSMEMTGSQIGVATQLAANLASSAAATTVTVNDVSQFPTAPGFVIRIDSEEMRVTAISGNELTVVRKVNGVLAAHVQNALVSQGNVANVHGGGLYNLGNALIQQNFFVGNVANSRGGAIYNATSAALNSADVRQSTFADNFASSRGAAIYNEDTFLITNSTISSNESGTNAAIGNTLTGTVDINNSTVVDNVAYRGGGLANTTLGTVTVKNTILANNQSTTIAGIKAPNARGTFTTGGNNFVGNNADSAGFVNNVSSDQVGSSTSPFDPVIEGLSDNGGQTLTQAPRNGSPAIDAGNNTGAADKDTVDQRGAPRPTNEDSDVGSVERQDIHLKSIMDVTLAEGTSGSTPFTFTLMLNQASVEEVRIDYVLQGDTAFAGEDFVNLGGTVVFAPGTLIQTIVVDVNGDTSIEQNEQFFVNLVNGGSVTLDDTRAVGTITTDDTGFRINDINRVENGDTLTQTYTFSVEVIGAPLTTNASVQYIVSSAGGAVTSPVTAADTVINVDNPSAFPTTGSFTILVESEQMLVTSVASTRSVGGTLSTAVAANDSSITVNDGTLFPASGLFTIQVDLEQMLVTSVSGNVLNVTRNAPVAHATTGVAVDLVGNFFNVTRTTPVAHSSGVAVSLFGSNTVSANVAVGDLTIAITDASTFPSNGGFAIQIGNEFMQVTDVTPGLGVTADFTVIRGFNGSVAATHLTGDVVNLVRTTSATGSGAAADFVEQNTVTTLSFDATHLVRTFNVTVNSDQLTEANESFFVHLTGNTLPFEFGKSIGVGTIFNDDLGFNISNASAAEADVDVMNVPITTTMQFNVTQRHLVYTSVGVGQVPTLVATTATIQTASGTATSGQDFVEVNQTLPFPVGTTSLPVTVTVLGDLRFEKPDETFQLQVASGAINAVVDSNVVAQSNAGTGTIVDFDAPPDQYHFYSYDGGAGTTRVRVDRIAGGMRLPVAGQDFLQGSVMTITQLGNVSGGGPNTDDLFVIDFNRYASANAADFATYDATGVIGPNVIGISNPIPTGGILVNGLGQVGADTVRFQGGTTFDSVVYDSTDANSGRVTFADPNPMFGARFVDYLNLEPVLDLTNAVIRDFNAPVGDGISDNIVVSSSGGFVSISSVIGASLPTFESVTALAPLGSLVIDGNSDANTILVSSADLTFTASLTVNGFNGDDTINLGSWSLTSTVFGGDGKDSITGGSNNDSIDGGINDDLIVGGGGNDNILGGLGNDNLSGNGGDDVIHGDDLLDSDLMGGDDVIQGNDGVDGLFGGYGKDNVDGGIGDETVNGGEGDDIVKGGLGKDVVLGDGGDDVLFGDEGIGSTNGDVDSLDGGFGDDTMSGEAGNDNINGNSGSDVVKYTDTTALGNTTITLTSTTLTITQKIGAVTTTLDIDTLVDANRAELTGGIGDNKIDASTPTPFTGSVKMFGLAGNDTLLGGDGDDCLVGGAGSDTLNGNNGSDTIRGGDGSVTLVGDMGDTITGGMGDDNITGDALNDTIDAGDGNDSVLGGDGNDSISGGIGTGFDTLEGGNGQDTLFGLDGKDSLLGGAGQDSIDGGNEDDLIDGGDGDDTAFGQSGNDDVRGGAGNDTLEGNAGDDSVNGMDGNDTLNGSAGDDTLFGGSGDDELISTSGNDQLLGQGGSGDKFTFDADNSTSDPDNFTITTYFDPNPGTGRVGIGLARLNPLKAFTTVLLGVEVFTLNLNNGNDLVTLADLVDVNDLTILNINGGDGNDTIDGSLSTSTTVSLRSFMGNGNDSVLGGAGNDIVQGEIGNDTIISGGGTDSLVGGDGNDSLNGNSDNDTINGGLGDDSIWGGGGSDSLTGLDGKDTIWGQAGSDTIDGGIGDDFLDGGYGDSLTAGSGDDSIRGGFGNDKIAGRDGADKLFGEDGNDTITGGDGIDVIDAGNGDDLVNGDGGNDTINGGAGNDVLLGGDGDDSILGGAGNDRLFGGLGKDTVDGQGGVDTVLGGSGNGTNTLAVGERRVGETINELFKITSIRSSIFSELNF